MKQTSKNKSPSAKKQYAAPALDKGLDIIELLAKSPVSLNQSEIAKKLDRSIGEIFRMLAVLEQRQYVALDTGSDKYHMTLKLFEVVHRHTTINRLTSIAAPLMRKLSQDIEQSCHLAIRYGEAIMVIAQQDSFSDRSFGTRIGARAPIFESCSGQIIYAFASPNERDDIHHCVKSIGRSVPVKIDLEKTISKIQKSGFFKVKSGQIAGVIDIGFPIFDFNGVVAACLVVPYLKHINGTQKIDIEGTKSATAKIAKAISVSLGALQN